MPNNKATTSLRDWNFQTQHVQQNLVGGDFVGSHSVILCGTAPRLSDLVNGETVFSQGGAGNDPGGGKEFAIPLGVVDSAALAQDRQLQQIFELGSKRSYFLSARTLTSFQIARVFYKGPSLLRMLYAYYPASKLNGGADNGNTLQDLQNDGRTKKPDEPIAMTQELSQQLPSIKNIAGYDNFLINLDSELFSQPMGLVLYIKDNLERDVGAIFLEECYVQNHGMTYAANSIVVAEQVTIRCERVVPMRVRVTDASESTGSPLSALSQGISGVGQVFGFDSSGLLSGLNTLKGILG